MKKSSIMMVGLVAALLVVTVAGSGCIWPAPSPDNRIPSLLSITSACKTPAIPGKTVSKNTLTTPADITITGTLINPADNQPIVGRQIILYGSNNYKPGIDFKNLKYAEVARATTDSNGVYQFNLQQRAAGYTFYGTVSQGDDINDNLHFLPTPTGQIPILATANMPKCA